MLNPINHARTPERVHRYKVEPYVVCADLYSAPPHVGRGGWTWYTGSAGWMYRAGLESILGFRLQGATLLLDPCIPRHGRASKSLPIPFRPLRDRGREPARRQPRRRRTPNSMAWRCPATKRAVPLADDGATHRVRVVLG